MQQRARAEGAEGDPYNITIEELNRYFADTCDPTKERMKFRELVMGSEEPFADWVLRLEAQAAVCEFEAAQRKEEILQAITRRSTPGIAGKLYEMASCFDNNLEKLISHGRHLDFMRSEIVGKPEEARTAETNKENGGRADESVNALRVQKQVARRAYPYRMGPREVTKNEPRSRNGVDNWRSNRCPKCDRTHTW
ncbi:uncharacterized protein LOC131214503, partial [Anopheles bellator]|uniref:uncharacterized protein LOC131214503 n=1 Tax=Anopheles bellator TaxID=139047 RepID=UPI002649A3B9